MRLLSLIPSIVRTGGFAHVYLVRTAEPVFGTTHHVLKRIAVANEAMLNDVKKEVDIMVRSFYLPHQVVGDLRAIRGF